MDENLKAEFEIRRAERKIGLAKISLRHAEAALDEAYRQYNDLASRRVIVRDEI